MARRCLVLVSTTSYRTDAFIAAARRLDAEVVIGSDRCHQLAGAWTDDAFAAVQAADGSLALDFRHPEQAAAQIAAAALAGSPFDAVVATDDHTAVIAAFAARALGLPGNAPDAVLAAHDKSLLRGLLERARVPCPRHLVFSVETGASEAARAITASFGFPVVAKPLLLSASRGVIRADDADALGRAWARIHAILRTRSEYADALAGSRSILVEEFIPGVEVALEGILGFGADDASGAPRLRTLALFDKPDPLDGPFFEETLYVTPSRLPAATQVEIAAVTQAAALALGLREGPIHAELRLDRRAHPGAGQPVVVEVAARSIGGLCARTLRFALGGAGDHALEELVLRQALRMDTGALAGVGGAAGVLMLPIPQAGVLRSVEGVDAARAVPLIEDVAITVRPGERLVPLPEGSSYPGFVFARGDDPAAVEAALREAGRHIRFAVAPSL